MADALALIEKDFGKGSLMRLGEAANQKVSVVSSGSLALDIALGAGGYPKGRIVEIYGPESSGKTTVALHAVAAVQKKVELQPLSMLKMRLTQNMQKRSVSISMNFYFHNQTMVNKGFKLLKN